MIPSGFAGVSPTRGGRSKVPAGLASPQGSRAPSSPPRAAFSHSASVGSRPPAQRVNAHASSQESPTTGWRGSAKAGSRQKAGGGAAVARRYAAYSSFVTGVVAMPNAPTHTSCTGRSHGCPHGEPMRNGPAAISTKSTPRSVASVGPALHRVPEIRYRRVFESLPGPRHGLERVPNFRNDDSWDR